MATNVYAGSRSVKVGAGTLYWAPLGTAEPVSVTGAWPSGWTPLGYTEAGSTFSYTTTTSSITPEEEFDPVANFTTARAATMAFNLMEVTAQNLSIALNLAGQIGAGTNSSVGVLGDGTIFIEAPDPGTETRIMLGWDSAYEAGVPQATSDYERIIMRQVFQSGNLQKANRKAPNEASYSCTFSAEKPLTGLRPFRFLKPAGLAQ
jgi:hypothetical protein